MNSVLDQAPAGMEPFPDLLSHAPIGVYVVNHELRVCEANAMARQIFGSHPDLIGRELSEMMHSRWAEPYAQSVIRAFRHTLATGEPYADPQNSALRLDVQKIVHYEWEIRRIVLADGRYGVACYFSDISERVHAQRELERQREALRLQNERLEFIQQAMGIGTFDWDMIHNTSEVSAQWRRIYGLPADAPGPTHEDWLRCVHPQDRERATASALSAANAGESYEREFRVIWPDGSIHWVLSGGKTLFDASGRPHRLLGAAMEITARKEAEGRIAQSDQRFRVALLNAPIVVFATDLELRTTWVHNTSMGADSDSILGKRDDEIFPYEEVAEIIAFKRRVLETGRGERSQVSASVGGGRYTFDVTLEPQFDAQGRVCGLLGAAMDVSELVQARAAAEAADRQKDEFLATLSHELRSPLASIRTAADILATAQLTSAQLQWSRAVIQRQVRHMALLLDDLLNLSRITQGKLALKPERVALSALVDAAIEASQPLIERKAHQLVVALPSEPVMLHADPLRLSQVIANVLTNAAKYTDPGGHICISAALEPSQLVLSIRDDGIGIPPAALQSVFEMFSQVDAAGARSEGGLGIGLALARGLMQLHGGSIEAASEGPGRGSEFILRLPLPDGDCATAASATGEGHAPAPRKSRVLVADDNTDAADTLGMLLELKGYDVRVAHGGRSALAVAREFHPHVALLDIGMPDLSGYDVARALRGDPSGTSMLLIALTGWGQDSDRQRAQDAGFDWHLTKPVDPDALQALLASRAAPQEL